MPSHGLNAKVKKTQEDVRRVPPLCTVQTLNSAHSLLFLCVLVALPHLCLEACHDFVKAFTCDAHSIHQIVVALYGQVGAVRQFFPLVHVIHLGLLTVDLSQDSLPQSMRRQVTRISTSHITQRKIQR